MMDDFEEIRFLIGLAAEDVAKADCIIILGMLIQQEFDWQEMRVARETVARKTEEELLYIFSKGKTAKEALKAMRGRKIPKPISVRKINKDRKAFSKDIHKALGLPL